MLTYHALRIYEIAILAEEADSTTYLYFTRDKERRVISSLKHTLRVLNVPSSRWRVLPLGNSES